MRLVMYMPSPTRGEGAAIGAATGGKHEAPMSQPLLIEHDDGVDRVTLNRP